MAEQTIAEKCALLKQDMDALYQAGGGGNTQEYYDEFWDSCQQNGNRKAYHYGFAGNAWNDTTFKPKYDIKPSTALGSFMYSSITDLVACLQNTGVTIDTKDTTAAIQMFYGSSITTVPHIDLSKAADNLTQTFASGSIVTILGITSVATTKWQSNTFSTNVESVTFYGTIATNFYINRCTKLNRNSLLSILQCLNSTVTGVTASLPSKCIDGATDTLSFIQSDTELYTAYTQALGNGYSITFA